MKVLIGFFNSESNEHTPKTMNKENFLFAEGNDMISKMGIQPISDCRQKTSRTRNLSLRSLFI